MKMIKMMKVEIIQIHKILSEIKKGFEKKGIANNGSFKKYNELNITPEEFFKPKEKHEKAIKILSEELAQCTR